ncbi:MAG TPA: hypothetical protein VG164_00605 [Trebonia sp.]|jgi:hypothetical protein|nr:hypothetical protein [Trebonia sp.]
MQPRNLPLADPPAPPELLPVPAVGEELDEPDELDDGALDVLVPQAASSTLTAAAAAVINAVCFTVSSTDLVAGAQA